MDEFYLVLLSERFLIQQMSHRRAGLKGIQQRQQQRQQFQAAGEALQKDQLDHVRLESFLHLS